MHLTFKSSNFWKSASSTFYFCGMINNILVNNCARDEDSNNASDFFMNFLFWKEIRDVFFTFKSSSSKKVIS